MAFTFPASPTVGQVFTSGTVSWQWDGVAWRGTGTSGINLLRTDQSGAITGSLTTSDQVKSLSFEFTGASTGARGTVSTSSAVRTRSGDGTTYGYGMSTNVAGGLDIMANQAGQDIRFFCGTSNASPTERMRIDNNGRITMPFQPAFSTNADLYSPQKNYNTEVIYNTANTNGITILTNIGSHFVASTGRFTAPAAGRYYFTGSFSRSVGNAIMDMRKNGVSQGLRMLSYGTDWQTACAGMIVILAANDYVEFVIGGTNGTTTAGYRAAFSGFQIS